ncbi:hypothetical protein SESBI_30828 [Sesbania bispinosa]|nr:hypothetical protein SESBI_30828 [Sesbania bispinosa]
MQGISSKKQKVGGTSSSKRATPAPKGNLNPPPNTHGLLDEIKWLIDKVGWTQFFTIKSPTYEKLTLEFLSSVEAQVLYGEGCYEGCITFRLNNEDHSLDLVHFNSIYGLPSGVSANFPMILVRVIFGSLLNLCLGGESLGNVKRIEIFLLWAMVNALPVDTGSHLARQFSKVGKAATSDIVIGGFITPIAHALSIDLSTNRQILGHSSRACDDDLAEDALSPSSFPARPFSGPLSITQIEAAQEQQRLQLEAFRAEQCEELQNVGLRQQQLEDMIQAHHQGDIEYRAMLHALYH